MKKFGFLILVLIVLLSVSGMAMAATLTLPDGVTVIEEEAFYGDTSLDEVVLPEGIVSIGSKAFANSSVHRIYLPESLREIARDAFDGATNVIGYGPDGTIASNLFDSYLLPFEHQAIKIFATIKQTAVGSVQFRLSTDQDQIAAYAIYEIISGEKVLKSSLLQNQGTVSISDLSADSHVFQITGQRYDASGNLVDTSGTRVLSITVRNQLASPNPFVDNVGNGFGSLDDQIPYYNFDDSILVRWNAVDGADSYRLMLDMIEQGEEGAETPVLDVNGITDLQYQLNSALWNNAAERRIYRLGMQSEGELASEINETYFGINPPDHTISISKSEWHHNKSEGATRNFTVTSILDWRAISDSDWIQVLRDNDELQVTLSSYPDWAEVRHGTVTVTNGKNKATLSVYQSAVFEAPTLSYGGKILSQDPETPTEIPEGSFQLAIDGDSNYHVIQIAQKNSNGSFSGGYRTKTGNSTIKLTANSTYSIMNTAGDIYRLDVSGHYGSYWTDYSEKEVSSGSYHNIYYVKMVEDNTPLLLNGQTSYTINTYNDSEKIYIGCGNTWTASADQEWISWQSSGTVPNSTLTVYVDDNYTGEARIGHVIVTSGSKEAVVTVIQQDLTPRLISPNNLSVNASSPTSISTGYLALKGYYGIMNVDYKSGSSWINDYQMESTDDSLETDYLDGDYFVRGRTYRITISDVNGSRSKVYYVKASAATSDYVYVDSQRLTEDSMAAGANSSTHKLKASGSWSASSNGSWLTVSPSSGSQTSSTTITVNAAANTTNAERSATLTFKIGSKAHATLTITQQANDMLEVTYDGVSAVNNERLSHCSPGATTYSLRVHTFGPKAEISTTNSWITVSSSVSSEATTSVKLAENTTSQKRIGTVTIRCGSSSKQIQFTQEAYLTAPVITTPSLSLNSSNPTQTKHEGENLVLKWNHVPDALYYDLALIQDRDAGIKVLGFFEANDTGSGTQTIQIPADYFDASYIGRYYIRISAKNQYTSSPYNYFFFTRSAVSSVLLNGRLQQVWENANDQPDSRTYTLGTAGQWNAISSANWIKISKASGANGDELIVSLLQNNGAAREGTVTVTCGNASSTISIQQCAALSAFPTISTPVLGGSRTNPTALALTDQSLTITWTKEPQARWYKFYILDSGNTVYSSGMITASTYTFRNLALEKGRIYSLEVERYADYVTKRASTETEYYFVIPPDHAYLSIIGDEYPTFYADCTLNAAYFDVEASGTWKATVSDPSWLQVNKKKSIPADDEDEDYSYYFGQPGGRFCIRVLPNYTDTSRTGTVTIHTYGADKTIRIVQDAYETYDLTQNNDALSQTETAPDTTSYAMPNPQYDDIILPWENAVTDQYLSAKADDDAIVVAWSELEGASGYNIYVSTNSQKPATPTETVKDKTLLKTITGLIANTNYNVWLEAFNSLGKTETSHVTVTTGESNQEENARFQIFSGSTEIYNLSQGNSEVEVLLGAAARSGNNKTLTIKGNSDWTVRDECGWLDIVNSQTAGSGNGEVILQLNDSSGFGKQTGSILFNVAGKKIRINLVKPEWTAGLDVSVYHLDSDGNIDNSIYRTKDASVWYNNPIAFGAGAGNGSTYKLYIHSNFDWTVSTTSNSWFEPTIDHGYGSDQPTPLIIRVNNRVSTEAMTGKLTFLFGESNTEVVLNIQKPAFVNPSSNLAKKISFTREDRTPGEGLGSSIAVNLYETVSLKAHVLPETANQNVEWSTDATSEQMSFVNGELSVKKAGTYHVYASAKDGSGIIGDLIVYVPGNDPQAELDDGEISLAVNISGKTYLPGQIHTYKETKLTADAGSDRAIWPELTFSTNLDQLILTVCDAGGNEVNFSKAASMATGSNESWMYTGDVIGQLPNPCGLPVYFPEDMEQGAYWITAIAIKGEQRAEVQMEVYVFEKTEPVIISADASLQEKFEYLRGLLPSGAGWYWGGNNVTIQYGDQTLVTSVVPAELMATNNHTHTIKAGNDEERKYDKSYDQRFGYDTKEKKSKCIKQDSNFGGTQCHGFACMIAWGVSGWNYYAENSNTRDAMKKYSFEYTGKVDDPTRTALVNELEPGDFVRLYPTGDAGHSIIVLSVDEKNITVVDCNYAYKNGEIWITRPCEIRWERKFARSDLVNEEYKHKLLYVIKYSDYSTR